MKLSDITMKNFLSMGNNDTSLSFSDFNLIVGPNNTGKTNVFRAITFASDCLSDHATIPDSYYHNSNLAEPLEIHLSVTPSEKELRLFSDMVYCSILSKRPLNSNTKRESQTYKLFEKFLTDHVDQITQDLFKTFKIIIKRKDARSIYRDDILFRLGTEKPLYLISHGDISKHPEHHGGRGNIGHIIVEKIRKKNRPDVDKFLQSYSNDIPNFKFSDSEITDFFNKIDPANKTGSYSIGDFHFSERRRGEKNSPQQMRLLEFFGGINTSHIRQDLVSLIDKIIYSSIIRTSDLRSKPLSFLTLENSIKSVNIDMKNLTGETLPEVLFQLRNSTKPIIRKRYNKIQQEFKKLCNGLEFDIVIRTKDVDIESIPKISNRSKHPFKTIREDDDSEIIVQNELVLHFVRGDLTIPVEHSAAGLFEILLLLTVLIGQQEKIILLDEPAVNLHPILQRQILEKIQNEVVPKNHNQVLMITHSPYLIPSNDLESIWRLYPNVSGGSNIVNVGKALGDLEDNEKQRIMNSFQYSDIRSAFFSKGIIFVEGLSDKLVLEQIDKYLSINKSETSLSENDWYVIEMTGGKHSLWSYIKMAEKLHIPFACVMDYDALMNFDKKIKTKSDSVLVSAVFMGLMKSELLSDDEISKISEISKKLQNGWVNSSNFEQLHSISKNHGCYVFSHALEGVLQAKVSKKESKPLKNLNMIISKINSNSIPAEFDSLFTFLHSRMTPHYF